MGRLEGKVAVVTGAGQGIGRGISRRFAREGACVLVAELSDEHGARVASDLESLGGRGLFVRTDVTDKSDVQRAITTAVEEFGRVDVLVNDAISLAPHVHLETKTDEMFEFMLKVGCYATLWGMQAVFPIMRDQGGGRIINFYSGDADAGQWFHSDYNVTKAAIKALTVSAAAEWARYNILCNAISPAAAGSVFEGLVKANPAILEMVKQHPLGRIGDPETDIAPVALFLATEDSQYVTGQTLEVTGGGGLATGSAYPEDGAEFVERWLDAYRLRA